MMQSKWVRVPVKILLIWMVITIYFYFQQPVIYRYQNLNANIPIGNAQLLFHEINVTNQDEYQQIHWMDDQETPWQFTLYQKMVDLGLPMSWYVPILKVISFYSWPPLAQDSYYLYIYGTFIYPEDVVYDESASSLERFNVYIYPGTSNGTGSQHEFFRNADMINVHGRIDPKMMDQPLIINVVDKEDARSTKLIFTPEWEKERLLQREERYKSPADPVRNFIHNIYDNQPQKAFKNVLPKKRDHISLSVPNQDLLGKNIQMEGSLSWIDVFEGYLNVYRVDTEIGEFSENNFIPQEKLTFYTVRDQDGNYKIIYLKPQG
ncbi:MAG: hypothetical protein GX808_11080 [Syntrophomonadaceae bacterium]|jgi:hypothetical protein|nr:hypothetical protein [Syntrophomonadaceae bacterium]